jgi:hypothetical protein
MTERERDLLWLLIMVIAVVLFALALPYLIDPSEPGF